MSHTVNQALLSPKAVAKLLDVQPSTVVRWIREEKIQAVKFGRVWRIEGSEVARIRKNGV